MFDPETLYTADELAEIKIAPTGTLANWRSQGKGPPYVKMPRRIVYRGRDLNEWIERQTVRPTA